MMSNENESFDVNGLEGLSAEGIYHSVSCIINTLSKNQIRSVCKAVLESEGNVAVAIALAKRGGWWDDSVKEWYLAILESEGNQAFAIYHIRLANLWDDSVKEYTRAILEAKGDQAWAIYHSKVSGFWDDSVKEFHQAILELEDSPNRELVINLSKQYGFWALPYEETEVILSKLKYDTMFDLFLKVAIKQDIYYE